MDIAFASREGKLTSKTFLEVVVLLDHLANAIDFPFFYSCIWRTMITNPSLRSPVLNYLLRRLPKISDQEGITYFSMAYHVYGFFYNTFECRCNYSYWHARNSELNGTRIRCDTWRPATLGTTGNAGITCPEFCFAAQVGFRKHVQNG